MSKKEKAIQEIKSIVTQLNNIVEQLQVRDTVYYSSPEIASMMDAIGMAWSVGTNPDTGVRQFTAYFREEK